MPYSNIDRSSDYFRIKLYTGNGSTQSITFDESKAMQPDLTWIKVRNDANVTLVHDVIRGATKEIYTPLTNAEATDANGLTAFNSNGFSVGSAFGVNRSGYNFVNWSWKANGTGVSNTNGSITSTVSANTTSGFSIVSYTGTGTTAKTVGHGLGVAPAMIIIKNRSAVTDWRVYHKSLGVNGTYPNFLELDLTTASNAGDSGNFASVPTSSVFGVGNYNVVNGNGNSMIAYCFAEVKGYSKAFSYTGNGSTDGTFVYTGFKPAFILIKRTNTTSTWHLSDNKRIGYNPLNYRLEPNNSNTEYTGVEIYHDMLSNGFKCRATDTDTNGSGSTYVGFAFAENPFVSSKGIPTTAR